jgi:O-antigen ligase
LKEIFIIQDDLRNKITYYHLLAFLVLLPFDKFYSELALISLLVHTIIHVRKEKILSLGTPFLFFASIYFLTIICTIYSSDKEQAFKDLEKQLAIILFPLIFSVTELDVKKYKLPLAKAFAITCLITTIYLYIDALRIISFHHLPLSSIFNPEFTNHNFLAAINLHATYFSMYVSMSIVVLSYFLINSLKKTGRIFYSVGILIFLSALIQLSSRSVLIASLLILNIVLPLFLSVGKARLKFFFASALL